MRNRFRAFCIVAALALSGAALSCGGGDGDVQATVGQPTLRIPTTVLTAGLARPQAAVALGLGEAAVADFGADRILRVDVSTGDTETLADDSTLAGGTRAVEGPTSLALSGDDLYVASVVANAIATAGRVARLDLGAAPAAPAIVDTAGLVHRPQGVDAATAAFPVGGERRVLLVASLGADASGRIVVVTLDAAGLAQESYALAIPAPSGSFPTLPEDLANLCDLAFAPPLEDDDEGLVGRLFVAGVGPRTDGIGCRADTDPPTTLNPSYAEDRVTMLELGEDAGEPGRFSVTRAISKTNAELVGSVGLGVATARPVAIALFQSSPGAILVANRGNGFLSLVGRDSVTGDLRFFTGLPPLTEGDGASLAGVNVLAGLDTANIGTAQSPKDRGFVSFTEGGAGSVRYFESLQ